MYFWCFFNRIDQLSRSPVYCLAYRLRLNWLRYDMWPWCGIVSCACYLQNAFNLSGRHHLQRYEVHGSSRLICLHVYRCKLHLFTFFLYFLYFLKNKENRTGKILSHIQTNKKWSGNLNTNELSCEASHLMWIKEHQTKQLPFQSEKVPYLSMMSWKCNKFCV